jgi:hypothetical protein
MSLYHMQWACNFTVQQKAGFSRCHCFDSEMTAPLLISRKFSTEAEFLDVIGTKEFSSLLFTVTVTSTIWFYSRTPLIKSGLKLVCYVNIVYGNLKSESSQNYAQKPQWNCTFMNSVSAIRIYDYFSAKDRNISHGVYTFNQFAFIYIVGHQSEVVGL